jgi:hypothetical protein
MVLGSAWWCCCLQVLANDHLFTNIYLPFPHSQSILRYQSALHRTLAIFARALPLLLGLAKETQTLIVPMMEHFVEDQANSVTKAIVSVSDSRLQVYSMQLHLVADFHGLRYVPLPLWFFCAYISKLPSPVSD